MSAAAEIARVIPTPATPKSAAAIERRRRASEILRLARRANAAMERAGRAHRWCPVVVHEVMPLLDRMRRLAGLGRDRP